MAVASVTIGTAPPPFSVAPLLLLLLLVVSFAFAFSVSMVVGRWVVQ